MPSSAMLTTHRFIYTVVGTPTDLVTWKGSGGSREVAFLESTELLLLVVVAQRVMLRIHSSGRPRVLFFCFNIIVGASSLSH